MDVVQHDHRGGIFHHQVGQRSFRQHRGGATVEGFLGKVVAVAVGAAETNKEIPRADSARVGGETGDRDFVVSGTLSRGGDDVDPRLIEEITERHGPLGHLGPLVHDVVGHVDLFGRVMGVVVIIICAFLPILTAEELTQELVVEVAVGICGSGGAEGGREEQIVLGGVG